MRHKEACIIAGTKIDGRSVLFKNRDRAYDANLRVYHLELRGVEIAFVRDLDSNYLEGLNEYGLGIVNTALMVQHDEQEGKGGKGKGKGPAKSKDGPKIFRALVQPTIDKAMVELLRGDPIKGHTFICQGDELYCIEASRTHKPQIQRLELSRVNTRTNHGVAYPDAGYTQGDDYVSSIVRRWETQKRFQDISKPEEMATVLRKRIHDSGSSFNPVRDTEKMRTTNQVMFDLNNRVLHLYLMPGHSTFHGVKNFMTRDPKIKLKVWKHR